MAPLTILLFGLVVVQALVALVCVLALRSQRQEANRLRSEQQAAEKEEQAVRWELRRLRDEVDMLAAIREISLVANEDVDLRRILAEALRITEQLVESRMLSLHLWDDEAQELDERARREEGSVELFDDRPSTDSLAREAFVKRRSLTRLEGGCYRLALLMFADRRTLGVLRADLPAIGLGDEALKQRESQLTGLAKHITLAIRKPTLYHLAVLDSLTGLFSRRHFNVELRKHFGASRRLGTPLSLLLLDIDHFKSINDTYGHLTGDRVLAQVAEALRLAIREYDSAFRYGGEELAILAPDCDLAEVETMAERLRRLIGEQEVLSDDGRTVSVTVSIGVSSYREEMLECRDLVLEADNALYHAKSSGRNQVTLSRRLRRSDSKECAA